MEYTLRYCYRYEPGFNVYSLLDLVLYKETDDIDNYEILEYLKKEDELIDDEDKYQCFFRVNHFKMPNNPSTIYFVQLELFPKSPKDDSVLNLIYMPLEKPWKEYTNIEQIMMIDKEIKNQESIVDFKYDLVNYSIEEFQVENTVPTEEEYKDEDILEE